MRHFARLFAAFVVTTVLMAALAGTASAGDVPLPPPPPPPPPTL